MALYLGGGEKLKLNFSGSIHHLIIPSFFILNGIKLLSSDNYILTDINGLYITVKESE